MPDRKATQNSDACPSSFFGLALGPALTLAAGGCGSAADPAVTDPAVATAADDPTGASRAAESFAVRLTAVEISWASKKSSGAGTISAAAVTASTWAVSSQRSNPSGAITTGMRSWIGARARFAMVVTMQAVSTSSPLGPDQVSHNPANAIGPPPRGRMK